MDRNESRRLGLLAALDADAPLDEWTAAEIAEWAPDAVCRNGHNVEKRGGRDNRGRCRACNREDEAPAKPVNIADVNADFYERCAALLDGVWQRAVRDGGTVTLTEDEILAVSTGRQACTSEARTWRKMASIA